MGIDVVSYGGKIGFDLRRVFPKLTSFLYLNLQEVIRAKETKSLIDGIMRQEVKKPLFVNIETINRCNGTCPFCPANVKAETRPLKKMSDELFYKIIADLETVEYDKIISLYINNEPFLDTRMPQMLKYVREHLPKATVLIFTNGTMLTPQIMDEIADCFDQMYINNYNTKYELLPSSKAVFEYVKANEAKFCKCKISIQMRYANELLANRAGTAPNKPATQKKYKWLCLMPYTDMCIFPDGKVGLCCNDTKEVTDYGNVREESVLKLFNSDKLNETRRQMASGRNNIEYCSVCDVIDSGIRLRYAKELLL